MKCVKNANQFYIKEKGKTIARLAVLEDCQNHRRAKLGERIYIQDLYVEEEYRRNGYATILITHVIDYYKAHGISEITLAVDSSNIAAKELYKKLSFRRIQIGIDLFRNRTYELLIYGERVL